MNNQTAKKNIVKIMAIAAVILPTVLLQAQSSQAIPLDGILDSFGKAFVRGFFGLPAENPQESPQPTTETENPNTSAPETSNSDGAEISTDISNSN
ncbi:MULTISPECIES: hypothetical protein [unclassified Chamaesiphon]|uniref:hypothetical protein n=1 Tax=unclassified Chamaesiphon TaxID=2620921 RepID=UPI00286A5E68|nr:MULTISPECIES: hypothetical protein [unclassified Chamaesiphon]